MKSILLATLFVGGLAAGGCAAGATTFDRDISPRTGVRLDSSQTRSEVIRVVPAAVEAQLPSADRIAARLRHTMPSDPSVDLDLCIRPDGRVASAQLVRASQLPAFDEAVLRDVKAWQFEEMPGPTTLKNCQRRTVVYIPRA